MSIHWYDARNLPCGPILYLTVRRGPKAGLTAASCTCGWDRTYKTRRKAEKRGAEHLRIANGHLEKEPING